MTGLVDLLDRLVAHDSLPDEMARQAWNYVISRVIELTETHHEELVKAGFRRPGEVNHCGALVRTMVAPVAEVRW